MDASLNYRVWRVMVRSAAKVLWNWKVYHPERVPQSGPVILASSHASFGDPPLVGSAVPRTIHFLARESLFQNPLFGAWLRSLNTLPIDRDGGGGAGLRTALEVLGRGELLLLFPEGTRSPDGQIQRGRPGTGLIALKSGAPVVPIRVFGLAEAWGRGRLVPGWGRVIIKFGHPLTFANGAQFGPGPLRVSPKAHYQQVTDAIMRSIQDLTPWEDVERFP